jgi:hypothetical protein
MAQVVEYLNHSIMTDTYVVQFVEHTCIMRQL